MVSNAPNRVFTTLGLVRSVANAGRSLAMVSPEKRSGFIVLTNSDKGGQLIYYEPLLALLDRVLTGAEV